VQRQQSLIGDGIGHVAFAGVAVGYLAGISPVLTALVAAVVGAVAIEWLRSHGRASGDLALALFFYGGIAAGVVLISRSGSGGVNVLPYLFGSVLTATRGDVNVVLGLGACIVLTMLFTGRALFAIVLDEESARVSGLPVDMLNTMLAALTAVTIVAAMRVVGVLLVAAMMVLPVATSRLVARSFRTTVLGAVGVGMLSVVIGLTAARAWSLAPGGAIVLAVATLFAITSVAMGVVGRNRVTSVLPGH